MKTTKTITKVMKKTAAIARAQKAHIYATSKANIDRQACACILNGSNPKEIYINSVSKRIERTIKLGLYTTM